ncbi:MAG: hypothetical protein LM590_09385 [Thermofilum sp.]|nr:hypothetical protein [Thermofilum sp.]
MPLLYTSLGTGFTGLGWFPGCGCGVGFGSGEGPGLMGGWGPGRGAVEKERVTDLREAEEVAGLVVS